MVHAILSDVVTPDRRAEAFFYLASTMLLTEILAPPLGSVLMQRSVFTPLISGFPFELASLVVLSLIPNTIKLKLQREQHQASNSNQLANNVFVEDESVSSIDENQNHERDSKSPGVKQRLRKLSTPLLEVWTLISRNRNILLVNISFLVTTLGRETLDFLVQYTSKRFNWSLAKVRRSFSPKFTYLLSFDQLGKLSCFIPCNNKSSALSLRSSSTKQIPHYSSRDPICFCRSVDCTW